MLSLFPSLLAFEQVSPFFLRLTLGIIFIHWAYKKYKKPESKNNTLKIIIDSLLGILFILGLFTQLVTLISMIIFAMHLFVKIKTKSFFTDGVNYYFILFIISLSLLITGPGSLSFDLPL